MQWNDENANMMKKKPKGGKLFLPRIDNSNCKINERNGCQIKNTIVVIRICCTIVSAINYKRVIISERQILHLPKIIRLFISWFINTDRKNELPCKTLICTRT